MKEKVEQLLEKWGQIHAAVKELAAGTEGVLEQIKKGQTDEADDSIRMCIAALNEISSAMEMTLQSDSQVPVSMVQLRKDSYSRGYKFYKVDLVIGMDVVHQEIASETHRVADLDQFVFNQLDRQVAGLRVAWQDSAELSALTEKEIEDVRVNGPSSIWAMESYLEHGNVRMDAVAGILKLIAETFGK